MHIAQPIPATVPKNAAATTESVQQNQRQIFRGYIPELDALRAIGILVVVLNHTFPDSLSHTIASGLTLGWAFMDSFFVMSGFLITGILLDTKTKPDYFKNFYIRRAFRILPLYYLVIVALIIAMYASGDHMPGWGSPWWFLVYLGNIPTVISGQWPSSVGYSFTPLWSLQIEEQFYLLAPLLIRFTPIEILKRVFIAMIPLSLALRVLIYWLWPENLYAQYVLLPCRLEGFALGALIAMRYRSGPWVLPKRRLTISALTWISLTVGIAIYGGLDHRMPLIRTVGFFVSSVASAYLILWLIEHQRSLLTASLRWRAVQHLGKISYGVYLVHIPLMAALAAIFAPSFPAGFRSIPALLTVGPLSVIVASFLWTYFESPILKLKDSFSGPGRSSQPARLRRAIQVRPI